MSFISHQTMPTPLSTIEVFPDERLTQEQRIEKWCIQLCRALEHDYESHYTPRSKSFTISVGRKYYKILEDKGSVHAFVDRKTGQVYKPASWNKPAKHVRYDLRIIREREACLNNADWAGSYLYLRG